MEQIKKGEFIASIVSDFEKLGVNINAEDLSRRAISAPDNFARAYLWAKVQQFQEITGKKLFSEDAATPLKYLGSCMAIGEIDNFFSENGSEKISEIQNQYEKLETMKTSKTRVDIKNIRGSFLKKYADYCGLTVDGLENRKVKQCFLTEIPGDWKTAIFSAEDDLCKVLERQGLTLRISKGGSYIGWIDDETLVSELADVFADSVYKK